jgi:hypothetical protein
VNEARDDVDGTALSGGEGSGVSKGPRPKAGELVFEAARLQLAVANHLLTLGNKQVDFWLDRARRLGTATLPDEAKPVLRLRTRASDDHPPVWKLHVYNASKETRTVRLTVREGWFWGGAPTDIECHPRFASGDARIPPGADQEVHLVPCDDWAAKFQNPGAYVAQVEVRMQDRLIGKLELTLLREGP